MVDGVATDGTTLWIADVSGGRLYRLRAEVRSARAPGMGAGVDEAIARVETADDGSLEVAVNFGVLTGRQATNAELEELGRRLVADAGDVSLVSEERFELGAHSEAELHQVRLELDGAALDEELRARVVATAEAWARACAADRHADVTEL